MLGSSPETLERLERLSLSVGERIGKELFTASPPEFLAIGVEKREESSLNLGGTLGGVRVVSLLVFTSTLVG